MNPLRRAARRIWKKTNRTSSHVPSPLAWQGLEPLESRVLMSADNVLDWNQVALDTVLADSRSATPDQGGPTRTARALAIVHAAIFDAYNAVHRDFKPLFYRLRAPKASDDAAVSRAAYETLLALYPSQQTTLDLALTTQRAEVTDSRAERRGERLGRRVAHRILKARRNDGSQVAGSYTPSSLPGAHQPDPLNLNQGFLTPAWGGVSTFGNPDGYELRLPAFPSLGSEEYTEAFEEVRVLGALDAETMDRNNDGEMDRSDEQTEIGLFWGYDHRLGTPPRLYNIAARVIADQMSNTVSENARLFALVNIAMADAGCVAWDMKYAYNIWRPVVAIRNAGDDDNPDTIADANWTPLGAPANFGDPAGFAGAPGEDADPDPNGGPDFTPPFPAYTSGHATFGAAAFRTIANFYGNDDIGFDLLSEDSGTTRHFDRLSQASEENGRSRIYLGIHWSHDDIIGRATGNAIADTVFTRLATPLPA